MNEELIEQNKKIIRESLDLRQEQLQQKLVETVRKNQFGDKSADVSAAQRDLVDFVNEKSKREKEAVDALEQS